MDLADENNYTVISPTVLRVIEQFIAVMRADSSIEDSAIDRLENLLRQGSIPKPEKIDAVLFKSSSEDKE